MKKLILAVPFLFITCFSFAQQKSIATDTLNSFFKSNKAPLPYSLYFKNGDRKLSKKIAHANVITSTFNISCGLFLFIAPEEFSQWNKAEKLNWNHILNQYQSSFTQPLVIDHDHWYVNYIGHPYQGSFYYNNLRSQGATALQSSLYCLGQTIIWEYVWEGGMEQPSIQDFITTPILGIVLGELSHIATLKMSKGGFKPIEKVITSILNPSFLINKNFRLNK